MSQAHFFRVKVIEAVRDSLNDIYNARDTKLQEAKAELAALDKKMADRTWWKKISACGLQDGFARALIEEKIRTNGDWYIKHESRLQVMWSFCTALQDDTVSITAQEFKDFSKFFKG